MCHKKIETELRGPDGQIKEDMPLCGKKTAPVDRDLLRRIISRVERNLAIMKRELEPEKKAELIPLLYEYSTETGKHV